MIEFNDFEARVKLASDVLDVPRFKLEVEAPEGDGFIEIASAILAVGDREYPRRVDLDMEDVDQSNAVELLREAFHPDHPVWDFVRVVKPKRGHMGHETAATYVIDGREIDVVGCWDEETPEDEYDFYDLYAGRQHLNLGDAWYPGEYDATEMKPPSEESVRAVIEEYLRQEPDLFA